MIGRRDDQVPERAPAWGVVVPVKHLDVAKSRLAVLGDSCRRRLALAFAQDVVEAALGCPDVARVVVVTDDEQAASALAAAGARVVPDAPRRGLNAALSHGATVLQSEPAGLGVAAVSADLPALRAGDLGSVLRQARHRAVVADVAGTGTTVLAAVPGRALAPAFGGRSLARHLASGAELVTGPPGARRDVDTPDDLSEALLLGVGPRTAAAVEGLPLPAPGRGAGHAAACRCQEPGTILA